MKHLLNDIALPMRYASCPKSFAEPSLPNPQLPCEELGIWDTQHHKNCQHLPFLQKPGRDWWVFNPLSLFR